MKSAPFEYVRAESGQHAVEVIAGLGEDAKFIAGGQSLVPLMAMRLARPTHLVDISELADLSRLEVVEDGGLRIGAATVQRAVEKSSEVARACPLLPAAVAHIGHFPIRNRGTIGGGIAHADPASELPLCALVLDAELVASRAGGGRRVIAASDFYLGPLTTALRPDELLEEIRVPAWPAGAGWGFHEFSRRNGDFAIVGVAAILELGPDGTISSARIGVAGAAPEPYRPAAAEALLRGQRPGADVFTGAGEESARAADPASDIHGSAFYRRRLAGVLTERALVDAVRRAGAGAPI
jgi:aerobic carbon-monoxide dehydrogenase medium subunit